MALESSPDQTGRKVKHAMLLSGRRSSSSASISTSVSLNDSAVESISSVDCNPIRIGPGNIRRHGTLENSQPLVHSVGRAVEGLSAKASQPDLINHHIDCHSEASASLESALETALGTNTFNGSTQHDPVPNCVNQKKRLSDAGHVLKLNIPGNSVVVSNSDPITTTEAVPIPVVTADKLRLYPPGLITIVKEGPVHESHSSTLLATIERELENLEPFQQRKISSSMAADNEIAMNGVEQNGQEIKGCHCRLALQDRVHATVKDRLQLQHQVDFADSKCARWEREAGEAADNNAMLKARISELEIDLAARNASLHGLKAKVTQQHMENDEINERQRRFERDCKAQLTQLDSLKKSEIWYREELHRTQVERSTSEKKLMTAQEECVRKVLDLQKLSSELKRVKDQLEEKEEKSLKEKQIFTMKLEKALTLNAQPITEEPQNKVDEHHVSELKQHIADLQLSLESSKKNVFQAGEEIGRLLSGNMQLQRELSETKIRLRDEEGRYLSATKDREKAEVDLQERDNALVQLSREHATLSVSFECQARERAEQDEAVELLKNNLQSMSSRFNAMRTETKQHRAEVEAMRDELRATRAEHDVLQARFKAAVTTARVHAGERDTARGAREAQLEHEVLALREATERSRGVQQRVEQLQAEHDQLQAERDQLSGLNDQLHAQVDRLSQLLQQNTGSRVRDGLQSDEPRVEQLQAENNQLQVEKTQLQMERAQLQGEVEKSGMVKEQMQTENHQLQGQVQRSAARLEELNRTIQDLEAEMVDLRLQQQQRGEEDDDDDDAEAEALEAEMTQLRMDNAQLLREKLELTSRNEELSLWLDTMTQGLGMASRGQAMERLARLSTSSVSSVHVENVPDDGELKILRDANTELVLYTAALQRRLNEQHEPGTATTPRPPPDLIEVQGVAQSGDQAATGVAVDEGEARGLLSLLQVCAYRVREAQGILATDEDGDDLTSVAGRLACSLEALLVGGTRLNALEALEEEHRDLRDREGRRDDLVRTLMARLKDQVLARRSAEQKLAALILGADGCQHHLTNGTTSAAGDGLAGGEGDAGAEVVRLEQDLALCQANIAELHKQLFNERRDVSQLRKEVSSLRLGLDTANDMLDSNKVALGRSEAYGEMLKVSKDQLQDRFEKEQRDHEDCRNRLERLQDQLQEARAKDPLIESQIKTLGCHLHQRAGEVRALQEMLSLKDSESAGLRDQLDRQRASARTEYDALRMDLQQAQREFAEALRKMSSNVPDPTPCDEEGLSALIRESNQMSPAVLDDLKILLRNLKAELKTVENGVGLPESLGPVVQHV